MPDTPTVPVLTLTLKRSSWLVSEQIDTQDATSYGTSAFNAPSVYYLLGVKVATNASQTTAEAG